MKALILALLVLWLSATGAFAAKECDQYRASITTGAMGVTEKVAAIPNKRIYLCGYMIIPSSGSGSSLDFELSAGTGVACAGNHLIIIPRTDVPPAGIVNRIATASGETAPAGYAMCLQTWGTGSVSSVFYWAQF